MDVTLVSVRSRFALVATALALSPLAGAEEPAQAPALDPSWRSPWTVSISIGYQPVHASTQTCMACGALETPSTDTFYHRAVAVDVIVPITVARSAAGQFTFDIGPEGQVLLFIPGWPPHDPDVVSYAFTFSPAGGLSLGVRDRVSGPPAPGGRPGFEYGFRIGALFGPGFDGVMMSTYAEASTGWALAPRWTPSPADGLPAEPLPARRTALVVGPYARGYYGTNIGAHTSEVELGPMWAVEAGLRIDLRRETRLPPP